MSILQDRRFGPLFVTQFFGAFNDNFLKNALVLFITLNPHIVGGRENSEIWNNIFAAIFIAPYFLFSITAGELSDKFPRDRIARYTKVWELGLMLLAGTCFYIPSPYPMAVVLFLMGMQSTFFSPAKYSILPQLLSEKDLVSANAMLESGTYLAIIGGTLAGTILIGYAFGAPLVWALLIVFAIIGYLSSRAIPKLAPVAPELRLDRNPARGTVRLIRDAARLPDVFFAIITGSWFWVLGIVLLAQIPALCKNVLRIDAAIPLFFLLFTVGIGIGTALVSRLMRGIVQTTPVPYAVLLMALCLVPLAGTCEAFAANVPAPNGIADLFRHADGIKIMLSMLGVTIACGLFLVPLNTLIQYASPADQVARMISANNIVNAIAMALAAIGAAAALKLGGTVTDVIRYTGYASVTVFAALVIVRPSDLIRGLFQILLSLVFRVRVNGYEHYEQAGRRTLVIANHVSLIDGVLLAVFLPTRLGFASSPEWTRKWFVRAARSFVNFFPVDAGAVAAISQIVAQIKAGSPCVIFPEGRITRTGELSPLKPGAGLISARAGSAVLPIAITGNDSYFSYRTKRRLFPRITLEILPALPYSGETKETRQTQIEAAMHDIQTLVEKK